MGVTVRMSTREYARHQSRASKRGGTKTSASLYRVEGVAVTAEAVAERLGVSREKARQRIYRERKKGEVTWEGLSV